MTLTKFKKRMQGVLPPEELPSFFSELEVMGMRPRKSLRIRRDLAAGSPWTFERLRKEGIPLEDGVSWYDRGYFFDLGKMEPHPSQHPVVASGLVFIQEAGAMEVVPELEISLEDLVLDLCAAPGAKSSHIGEYLGRGESGELGWLVANEPVRDRAKLLDVILARHGIANSTVFNLEPHALAKHFPEVFDRVLVDAPCSGESLFAKRDEKRSDVTDKEVERCALRQSAILANAARMLVPGGRLVYSTCAYSRTENEDVVVAFLAKHPKFRLLREKRRFPHRDSVPGGYLAVLVLEGEDAARAASRASRREALRAGVAAIGERGLVRDGVSRWDRSPDFYSLALDRRKVADETNPVTGLTTETLSREEAIRFLTDPAGFLRARASAAAGLDGGNYRLVWEGENLAVIIDQKVYYPKARLR